jgi:hypothetical protein
MAFRSLTYLAGDADGNIKVKISQGSIDNLEVLCCTFRMVFSDDSIATRGEVPLYIHSSLHTNPSALQYLQGYDITKHYYSLAVRSLTQRPSYLSSSSSVPNINTLSSRRVTQPSQELGSRKHRQRRGITNFKVASVLRSLAAR